MSLPVINTPTYDLAIPSTKEKIKFRPFLVNEEKILLLALEMVEEDIDSMTNAVKQFIDSCTFGKLDINSLALFDLEFLFLRIRAKSVGEVAKIKVLSPDDEETYVEVDVALEDVEIKFNDNHTNNIKLSDDIGVIMKYPQYQDITVADGKTSEIEVAFNMIKKCVSSIYEGYVIHERVDFSDDELETFINSLGSDQFAALQNFFVTMPKLSHEVKFKNPNTKKQNKVTLEGLQSFFA